MSEKGEKVGKFVAVRKDRDVVEQISKEAQSLL
jgi:hypothetical protein